MPPRGRQEGPKPSKQDGLIAPGLPAGSALAHPPNRPAKPCAPRRTANSRPPQQPAFPMFRPRTRAPTMPPARSAKPQPAPKAPKTSRRAPANLQAIAFATRRRPKTLSPPDRLPQPTAPWPCAQDPSSSASRKKANRRFACPTAPRRAIPPASPQIRPPRQGTPPPAADSFRPCPIPPSFAQAKPPFPNGHRNMPGPEAPAPAGPLPRDPSPAFRQIPRTAASAPLRRRWPRRSPCAAPIAHFAPPSPPLPPLRARPPKPNPPRPCPARRARAARRPCAKLP